MSVASCVGRAEPVAQHDDGASGRSVVVWISLDGFRPDYFDRAETPTLDMLMREGAWSRELAPVFPSLTFPSHVAQATGVTVSEHGAPGNSFYDSEIGMQWRYPPYSELVESEAIWFTAPRQGVRTAVVDWTMSHQQTGEIRSDYFGERYDGRLSDDERLGRVLEIWRNDTHEEPLRLLMGYATATDSAGHRFGPDAPEMSAVINQTDRIVGRFVEGLKETFREKMDENDELYLLITTDHGMSEVHSLVNAAAMLGLESTRGIRIVTSGNVGAVFLNEYEPASDREAQMERMIDAAAEHEFARVFRKGETPAEWGYEHPTRTGDLTLVLDKGYTFSTRPEGVVGDAREHGGPLGMHGYNVTENPEMLGITILWRYPEPLSGADLGPVHSLQLHPTVCKLLGIDPAPKATHDPIRIPASIRR